MNVFFLTYMTLTCQGFARHCVPSNSVSYLSQPNFGPLEYRSTRRKPKFGRSSHLYRSHTVSVRSAGIPLSLKKPLVLKAQSFSFCRGEAAGKNPSGSGQKNVRTHLPLAREAYELWILKATPAKCRLLSHIP